MCLGQFTKTGKNITIENFICSQIGDVKIYKSKKRMELRLSKEIIKSEMCIKVY